MKLLAAAVFVTSVLIFCDVSAIRDGDYEPIPQTPFVFVGVPIPMALIAIGVGVRKLVSRSG